MDFSSFTSNHIINWVLRGKDMPPAPTQIEIALYTVLPDRFGNGGKEVLGGSYNRVILVTSEANFSEPDQEPQSQSENLSQIIFSQASSPWGLIVGSVIWTSDSPQNILLRGILKEAERIGTHDTFWWDPGDFIFKVG